MRHLSQEFGWLQITPQEFLCMKALLLFSISEYLEAQGMPVLSQRLRRATFSIKILSGRNQLLDISLLSSPCYSTSASFSPTKTNFMATDQFLWWTLAPSSLNLPLVSPRLGFGAGSSRPLIFSIFSGIETGMNHCTVYSLQCSRAGGIVSWKIFPLPPIGGSLCKQLVWQPSNL